MNVKSTKKAELLDRDTLRDSYRRKDLGKGTRGKYFRKYASGTNLVLLSPELAKAFPTSQSVNSALRTLLDAARRVHGLHHEKDGASHG